MVIIFSVVWLIVYAQHGKRILVGANLPQIMIETNPSLETKI